MSCFGSEWLLQNQLSCMHASRYGESPESSGASRTGPRRLLEDGVRLCRCTRGTLGIVNGERWSTPPPVTGRPQTFGARDELLPQVVDELVCAKNIVTALHTGTQNVLRHY